MKPKISIVLPILNEGDNVEKCLSALRKQAYSEKEIIVVDNGSTDKSAEIAKRYADRVIFERRKGISFAKNAGIRASRGEFIAFIDADCIPYPDWLEELLKCFSAPGIVSVGGSNLTPPDSTVLSYCIGKTLELISNFGSCYAIIANKVIKTLHNPGCNVMYRKEIFQEAGLFNESLVTVEDEELDFRIRKKGYTLLHTPYAKVSHIRRRTFQDFTRQVYRYAIGRMQAIKLHIGMFKLFRVFPSLMFVFLFGSLCLSLANRSYFLIFTALSLGVLFVITALGSYLAIKTRLRYFLYYWLILFLCFFVWAIGFIRGSWKKAVA